MPYQMRKLPKQDLYRVYNPQTKEIHSYGTTLENAKKQITLLNMIEAGVVEGGAIAEDNTLLRPFFARIGSKVPMLRDIIPIIPPHKIYVEPFVGGGAVFWNKEPAEKSVINDLDKKLIQSYKILKRISPKTDVSILDNSKQVGKTYPEIERFIKGITSKSSDRDKLVAFEKLYSGTFGSKGFDGIYNNRSLDAKWKNISQYKDKLKTTSILNQDYTKVIKEYDSPDTFFFLDPPYEVIHKYQDRYYKDSEINYEKMRDLLKSIKGKFLLTINDSKYIRDIFKGFNFKTIVVQNKLGVPMNEKARNRKELFITNYNMKKGEGIQLDKFLSDEIVTLPKFNEVDLTLPTYMYKENPNKKSKYRYVLVTPTTKERHLASRKNKGLSVDVKRKPIEKVIIKDTTPKEQIKITDFKPTDQAKIKAYYEEVQKNEGKNLDTIPDEKPMNKPRGFPFGKKQKATEKKKEKNTEQKPSGTDELLDILGDLEDIEDFDMGDYEKKTFGKGLTTSFNSGKNIKSNNSIRMNSWVQYVKDYAAKKGMKYNEALKDPECKAGYKKGSGMFSAVKKVVKKIKGSGVVDELDNQVVIATAENQKELGANAGKKYISL